MTARLAGVNVTAVVEMTKVQPLQMVLVCTFLSLLHTPLLQDRPRDTVSLVFAALRIHMLCVLVCSAPPYVAKMFAPANSHKTTVSHGSQLDCA
jgi:hypothetical protein